MMLPEAYLLLLIHCFEVPIKRSIARLACVRFGPISRLASIKVHIPKDECTVFASRHEEFGASNEMHSIDFISVTVEFVYRAFAAADVPNEDTGIVASWMEIKEIVIKSRLHFWTLCIYLNTANHDLHPNRAIECYHYGL